MIKVHHLTHTYSGAAPIVFADMEVKAGEALLAIGPSGSGKSTLLHILAGILEPTTGTYTVDGQNPFALSGAARDHFRGRNIGIVFQNSRLIDVLSVRRNLELAQYLSGAGKDSTRIERLLEALEISDKADARIQTLSEGQKQRVAIARAMVNAPKLVLADEPTSALDDARATAVIDLLSGMASREGAALVITTHDQRVRNRFDRVITIGGGR